MSIGLYDYDFMNYTPVCFNLDLMKIASYYKNKKEVVVLAPTLEPERYSHFIIRKDYNDGNFDRQIFKDNVEYGGHAFSKNNYVSIPEEIQLMKPDKYLYNKYMDKYSSKKSLKDLFNTMVNSEHIRLSLDGKNIWNNYYKTYTITNKTRCIIFHDFNLNEIKDSNLIVKDIVKTMVSSYNNGQLIGMKFPIQVYNESDFNKWIIFNPMNLMFGLQYNGIMNNDFFLEFLLKNNSNSISKNLYYNITYGLSSEDDFIKQRLSKIFRQILLSRSLNKKILLTYDDNFFIDKRWERLIYLFNLYCNNNATKYKKHIYEGYRDFSNTFTLYRYITTPKFLDTRFQNNRESFNKDELRDLFQLVREKNYETFRMFYESCLVELKGGEIIDV